MICLLSARTLSSLMMWRAASSLQSRNSEWELCGIDVPAVERWYSEIGDNVSMAVAQTIMNWAACPVLESDPEKLSGAWVFRGTRVPISIVLENLEDMRVSEIAQEYPTVRREQITAFLNFMARSVDPLP